MLLFLTLLACGQPELEARIAELEAGQEALQADNDALRERVDELRHAASYTPRLPPSRVPPEPLAGFDVGEDGEVRIERATFDALDNEELGRMVRVLPHRDPDGLFDGYRLSGVRRDTPLEQVGLRNGDVLHSVNGVQLTSMEAVLTAASAAREADTIELRLTRRGSAETVAIHIVDSLEASP